jgi:RNA polymerase sigma-70 factor (ECF subfamily)
VLPAAAAGLLLHAGGEVGLLPGRGGGEVRLPVTAAAGAGAATPGLDTEAVWAEFRGRLRAFVARRISQAADVDDVVQWVLLRMHQRLGALRGSDRVHAWLYRIARRAIADYYRRTSRRREVPSGGAAELEAVAAAASLAAEAEVAGIRRAADCLRPLVERLPPPYRDAIVQADLEGVRLSEAAASARVSLSGMKSRVQRGRKLLRQLLGACCRIAVDGQGTRWCEPPARRPPFTAASHRCHTPPLPSRQHRAKANRRRLETRDP